MRMDRKSGIRVREGRMSAARTEELVARAQQGEAEAFGVLVEQYGGAVLGIALEPAP